MTGKYEAVLAEIGQLDETAAAKARQRQDSLTKPRGALGVLEDIAVRVAGITRDPQPRPGRKMVLVMAADHGVTAEGVSLYPSEVTPQMVHNFLSGGAAINVLARHAGAEVRVVDMGVAGDISHPELIDRKIKPGTANMAAGPAMTRTEARSAVEAGMEVALAMIAGGVEYLAMGEMGIGNTTAASAITACLSGLDPAEVTGRGTGLDDAAMGLKVEVIRRALLINRPDPGDALDVLAKVGGLEIAGMAGAYLAAAASRVPVLVDGFISAAGAYVATGLNPRTADFMIASHRSVERGHGVILEGLGLKPVIHAEMRLGEGTGAALAFMLMDGALKIQSEMATFEEAGVSGPE